MIINDSELLFTSLVLLVMIELMTTNSEHCTYWSLQGLLSACSQFDFQSSSRVTDVMTTFIAILILIGIAFCWYLTVIIAIARSVIFCFF